MAGGNEPESKRREKMTIQALALRIRALNFNPDGFTFGSTKGRDASKDAALSGSTDSNDRTERLCGWQLSNYPRNRNLSLGSNIYGPAVHDYMGANIRGGRASVTPRGASFLKCLGVLVSTVENDPTWNRYSLPETVEGGTEADISDLRELKNLLRDDSWGGARCW